MTSRVADLVVTMTFAGSLLLATTSCATVDTEITATVVPRAELQVPGAQRLVQFSFGSQAAFGTCVEPACPAVTPKSLPVPRAAPMQRVDDRLAPPVDMTQKPGTPAALPAPTPARPSPSLPAAAAVHKVVVDFEFSSAHLTETARTALSESIQFARQFHRIVVSDHANVGGNDHVSESLALARARSVRDYLLDQFPDLASVVSIDANRHCCSIAHDDTKDARSSNGRVEVTFFSGGGR